MVRISAMAGERTLTSVVSPIHFPENHGVADEERRERQRTRRPPTGGLRFHKESSADGQSHREVCRGSESTTLPCKRAVVEKAVRLEPRFAHPAN